MMMEKISHHNFITLYFFTGFSIRFLIGLDFRIFN